MPYYFIIGTIIFLIFCLICKFFSIKAHKQLDIKDKMLFIQQVANINKYSISILIAASVLFFSGMRYLDFTGTNLILTFITIVIAYTAVFSYFISKEIKQLKLPAKIDFLYVTSRVFLLLGLGIFILSLFLSFSNSAVIIY
jgi:hypothetical protein